MATVDEIEARLLAARREVITCRAWLRAHGLRQPNTKLRTTLGRVGDDWTVVRTGASRGLRRKLADRYPEFEFRHTRTSMYGGDLGVWTIEARRRSEGEPDEWLGGYDEASR